MNPWITYKTGLAQMKDSRMVILVKITTTNVFQMKVLNSGD